MPFRRGFIALEGKLGTITHFFYIDNLRNEYAKEAYSFTYRGKDDFVWPQCYDTRIQKNEDHKN